MKNQLNERTLSQLVGKLDQYSLLHKLSHGDLQQSYDQQVDLFIEEDTSETRTFFEKYQELRKKRYKVYSRSTKIPFQFIGMSFEVHNGKKFMPITIVEDMVGHRFGEFAPTRKVTVHKVTKTKSE